MRQAKDSGRNRVIKIRVLYSPSTLRIIVPVDNEMTGTIQLKKSFRAERVLFAAPIDIYKMAESWSNQEIKDWQEREVRTWKDLAEKETD